MSKIICTPYNSVSFIIGLKYDKNKYMNIAKQSGGRWGFKHGWVVPYEKENFFKSMFAVIFPDDSLDIQPFVSINSTQSVVKPDKTEVSEVEVLTKVDNNCVESDDDVDTGSRNKFRRARSATRDGKKPVDNKGRSTLEYYNSFKKTPNDFAESLYDKSDDFEMLSSDDDSSDASSSSGDFPIRSPKRKQHINDETVDKMEIMRMRMMEIDIRNKKEKETRRKKKV
jgi:hypothetical protein